MGTPLATLASQPGRRAAATLALLLILSACDAVAGTADRPVEGLMILTRADTPQLAVLAAKNGSDDSVSIGLPLPDGDTTWISAGDGGVLVGSTAEGKLTTSEPVDPRGAAADIAGLEWTPVAATDTAGRPLPAAGLATWAPGGSRFAALAGDFAGGGDITLVVVDVKDDTATTVALKRPLLASPPVWLDTNRLALLTGSGSDPATIVVDTASAKISDGPVGERRLATSADGKVIATSKAGGGPIVLRSSKGWLADDGTSVGSVEVPDGFADAISLALDANGDRLAIVWRREDGTLRADVHDGKDGWRRVWSQPVAGADTAAVAWLR